MTNKIDNNLKTKVKSTTVASLDTVSYIYNSSSNINPDHYKTGGIETIDIVEAKLSREEFLGFCKGNIIKYVTRANYKNGLEDYKKAQWYLDKLIKELGK